MKNRGHTPGSQRGSAVMDTVPALHTAPPGQDPTELSPTAELSCGMGRSKCGMGRSKCGFGHRQMPWDRGLGMWEVEVAWSIRRP